MEAVSAVVPTARRDDACHAAVLALIGLHLVFVDKAAHDAYQDDATHNKFIDENKPNWAGVRVFDSLV